MRRIGLERRGSPRRRQPRPAGLWVPAVLVCAGLMTAAGVGVGTAAAQVTNEATIDVGLGLSDLPAGFREVDPDDLVLGTMSARDTAEGWAEALSGSQLEQFRVYGSADDSEMVEVLLVGPLTPAEQTMIDAQFEQEEAMLEAIASTSILFVDVGEPRLLDTGDLGDSAFAYATTFTLTLSSAQMTNGLGYAWTQNRVEQVLARRGGHLILVTVGRAGGGEASVGAVDLAALVDRRLAAYLGLAIGGFRAADTLVPELTTHIPTPLDVSVDPAVVGTNLLLAALAMLVFVAAEELLRRTLAAEEGRLQRLLAPARWLARGQRRLDGLLAARLGRGAADALRLGAIVLLYGLIFSFLEPGWNPFTVSGVFLFGSLTVAAGLVGLAGDVSRWRAARGWGLPARLAVRPANLLLAVGSTTFSRLVALVPGIMIGTPEAFEIDETAAGEPQRRRLLRVGALTLAGLGAGAWLLTLGTSLVQRASLARGLAVFIGGLEALLLVVFAVAIQEMFVEMLGLEGSVGQALARRSRWLWFGGLTLIGFVFWHTLINPRGDLAGALGETSVRAILITIGAFCAFSGAVWAADRFLQRRRQPASGTAEPAEPAEPAAEPPVGPAAPVAVAPGVEAGAALAAPEPPPPVDIEGDLIVTSAAPSVMSAVGARLVPCPACGRPISSAARRCPGCGRDPGAVREAAGAAAPTGSVGGPSWSGLTARPAGGGPPGPVPPKRSWWVAIPFAAVLVGLGVGAFLLANSGSRKTDDGAAVVVVTTPPVTTTSTAPETTTTVDPALAPALAYFELLARNDGASTEQAADQATGYATAFAELLAAMDLGGLTIQPEEQGAITACYPTGPGQAEYCGRYGDFSLASGVLAHFSVNGRPLQTTLWRGSGGGWCRSYGECNWDDPASDTEGLYLWTRYLYLSPTGSLLVVWHVQTGQRDLDVIIGGDGRHVSFATDSTGEEHYADWCASPIADPDLSSLGLRLAKHQEGLLTCSFPGFGTPDAATAATATLVIDWGGRTQNEYELAELPGQ